MADTVLSKETLIPIGFALLVSGVCLSFGIMYGKYQASEQNNVYVTGAVRDLNDRTIRIETKMTNLEKTIDDWQRDLRAQSNADLTRR